MPRPSTSAHAPEQGFQETSTRPVTPSSDSSHSDSARKNDGCCQCVYQHIREIFGTVGFSGESCHEPVAPPSLGLLTDAYLQAHGYSINAALIIRRAYSDAQDADAFVEQVSAWGVAVKEAKFVWLLLSVSPPPQGVVFAKIVID